MSTRHVLVGAGLLLAALAMQPHAASAVDRAGCPAMAGDGESLGCKEGVAQPPEGVRYAESKPSEIEEKCRGIVSKLFGIDSDEISLSSSFTDDLGADDLDMAELVMAMEDRFDIEVPDPVAEKMLTFGDMVAIAASTVPAGASPNVAPSTLPPAQGRALPDHTASIALFGGDFCPKGTVEAAGQILAINDNQVLFALLGAIYGGDGRNTFALPDLRGKESAPGTRYCIVVNGIFPSHN